MGVVEMSVVKTLAAAFGRICLSAIFILAAIHKIADWQGTEQDILNALCDWSTISYGGERMQSGIHFLLSWVPLLLLLAFIFEMLGGLLVFFGIKVRFGAFLLLLFLIPTTLLFHAFWMKGGMERELQMVMFLKNVSIFGGLLLLLAHGKGNKAAKPPEKAPK